MADAPSAVYHSAQDRFDLSPAAGDTGRAPHVSDGRVSVDAAHHQLRRLGTQKMKADTNVRSSMQPSKGDRRGGRGAAGDAGKLPSMLKQDETGERAVEPAGLRWRELAGDL